MSSNSATRCFYVSWVQEHRTTKKGVKDEVKMQIRANSNSVQNTQTESSYRTLSSPTGHCPAPTGLCLAYRNSNRFHPRAPTGLCPIQPDIVRSGSDIVRSSKSCQRLVPFEISIYSPTPPMARISSPVNFTVLWAHFLHSKGLKHSTLEHPLQVLDLGFEWSKDSSFLCDSPPQAHLGSWIFIIHFFYSWSCAPRWLEGALEHHFLWWVLGSLYYPSFWL
jgi:hypothetical protein